jgi:Fe2+ transport system protein B
VTTGGGSDGVSKNYRSSTQKIAQLSETISEHGTKMLAVAKMKMDQRDKELSYAKQAEARNSIRTLGSEKRQLMIQMLAEKAKNNRAMEQVYADAIAEIDQKLEQENILLAESSTTPQKSNRSPSSNGQSGGLDRSLIE